MSTILITGGAGFIGSHLAEGMVSRGHRVRVLDNLSSGKLKNLEPAGSSIDFVKGDIRSAETCRQACNGVDVVIHAAALASVPASVDDPAGSDEVNVGGTMNMLQAAKGAGCRRFIYASSSSAYGDNPASPKTESMRPMPLSPYAVQKLAGEMYCQAFHSCYELQTIALRYFNVFGPRQDPAGQYAAAIPAFVTAALQGRPAIVFGDGEQTRDFTYIENVVNANVLAMEIPEARGQAINVACGEGISINRVIRAIYQALGKTKNVQYDAPRVGDVRHSTADITLARQLLKYEPTISFEVGIQKAIDAYQRDLSCG